GLDNCMEHMDAAAPVRLKLKITALLSMVLWYFSLTPTHFSKPALAQTSFEPAVVASTPEKISLAWTPPVYSLSAPQIDGEVYSEIDLPGLDRAGQPGAPELPLYSTLVGLPPTGQAQLRVTAVDRENIELPHPPLPAPAPQSVFAASIDPHAPPTGGPTQRQPDPQIYAADDFFPAAVAELGQAEQLRQHRLARLTIAPLRVNPVTRQVEVIRYLELEIIFDQPLPAEAAGLSGLAQPSPFDQTLAAALVNPEAVQWPPVAPAAVSGPNSVVSLTGANALKITVDRAGLYALTYADLSEIGLPVGSLDPRTLQITHGWPRQEIAVWVDAQAEDKFQPGDRLVFYAQPEFSRYVNWDVYFLSYGQANGLRMSAGSAGPEGLPAGVLGRTSTAEVNKYYDSHYPGRDGDYWYWDQLRQPDKVAATYTVQLDTAPAAGGNAALTVWLQGYTNPAQNPDHRVAVSVNGSPVGESTWDGEQAVAATFDISAAILQAGANQVSLSLPGINGVLVEGVWLDAIAITYPTTAGGAAQFIYQGDAGPQTYTLTGWATANLQVYDITNPAAPLRLTGYSVSGAAGYTLTLGNANAIAATYLVVPADKIAAPLSIEPVQTITDPPGGADYIIITPPDFSGAIAPLAAHRAAQGQRVFTTAVNAIYDAYGDGRIDPAAIKNYLYHAYTTWPAPAPTYVLLVGDGSYDFKNYSGYNPPIYIPPYLAPVDPWWGETAADNRYVTLAGNDSLPDMIIGRLPVNTAAEAAVVVDKIIRYETTPTPGDWNARRLFVADNPDAAGNFRDDSDLAYNSVSEPFVGQRFYYSPDDSSQPYLYPTAETLRSTFLNNFNQGAGFITFHGHSSWLQWAVEGLFRYYWDSNPVYNDLVTLRNQYRLPVVLEMTCFTASFHRPEYSTLDESLLRFSGGGAVAVWGSTGLSISTGHRSLQSGFDQAIYQQGERNLGAAILAGKINLYATGFHQDLLETFTLLGDPALNLNFTITPFANHIYLPIIQR
ncbi:MAG: C25 family cysteine peptidase, partial [Chloroflexota bacterium]